MYVTIADFIREWKWEASLTEKVLDGLTDDSLQQKVYPEGRTLGRIAWHFTTNIPEYLTHFGLKIDTDYDGENVPTSAVDIANTFKDISALVPKLLERSEERRVGKEYRYSWS